MGRSHTGGLYDILRYDNLNIAGGRVFDPGEDDDNLWVPVKSLNRILVDDEVRKICESQPSNVEKKAQTDEFETDYTKEIPDDGADESNDDTEEIHTPAPIDIGGEVSHILTSCEGPPDGALQGPPLDGLPGAEGSPALHSPRPARGGGEDGMRDAAFYEGCVSADAHTNTCLLYTSPSPRDS